MEGVFGHGSGDRGRFILSNNINPLLKEFMQNIMDVNGTIEAPMI